MTLFCKHIYKVLDCLQFSSFFSLVLQYFTAKTFLIFSNAFLFAYAYLMIKYSLIEEMVS